MVSKIQEREIPLDIFCTCMKHETGIKDEARRNETQILLGRGKQDYLFKRFCSPAKLERPEKQCFIYFQPEIANSLRNW